MAIDVASALIWFTAFLFSTTVHEAMHAFAAWRLGDPTAYNGGQVSLSPLPHVAREPLGMVVLPLLTSVTQGWAIGWASCPYDPVWAERYPKRAAIMAAAGPAGNLLVALAAFVLIKVGLLAGLLVAPNHVSFDSIVELAAGPSFITSLLSVFVVMNVFLAVFNLLPLPPLDGSAVFTIFLPEEYALRLRNLYRNPSMSLVGMLVAWKVFPAVIGPLFGAVLRVVHPGLSYS
ncbi:MAG TPA: site-2 protease family protein [Vicinamibacterales bacterium]|jgi:Zn-dependent protease|nr:site-2 protease family protein [Vicinamibacterales bacterium]